MTETKNLNYIPEISRALVEKGLESALKKGSLGGIPVNFIQIENSLSGGKTGAVVFVARYGYISNTSISEDPKSPGMNRNENSSFIRVLKVARKEICLSENIGYEKTKETLLDIFSQVEYHAEDEFEFSLNGSPTEFGILLYQDVGTVSAGDLRGIARYISFKLKDSDFSSKVFRKVSRELSLLLQKEVFLGLKKGLYGILKKRNLHLASVYGKKINSEKIQKELNELRAIDPSIPEFSDLVEIFNLVSFYYEVNNIHGDLNNENVLVWENERGFLSCKIIDFGEVIPKKKDGFTPLFWDFSRLFGELILNYIEESFGPWDTGNENSTRSMEKVNFLTDDIWYLLEGHFSGFDYSKSNKKETLHYPEHLNFYKFIIDLYISTLFDFLNEAKSGILGLYQFDVLRDYFYCQILFFIFYIKFKNENPFKRLIALKLALRLRDLLNSESLKYASLLNSLERFYFEYYEISNTEGEVKYGPPEGIRSPFMGLSYFKESDSNFFFGREALIKEVESGVREKKFIALAGASGTGKSSVVHAGILPIFRKENHLIYKFRPGKHPYRSLRKVMQSDGSLIEISREILQKNPGKKIFILGDQFEEVFTLCEDREDREEFAHSILECILEFPDQFKFFITIRSDFWTRLLEDPFLSTLVGDSGQYSHLSAKYFIGPMSLDELRSVIEKPIAVSGVKIQEGLTDLILTAIEKDPGSLPLLEFCLEQLWNHQINNTLNYESYKAIGEVKGALASYADGIYEKLDEDEKLTIQKIFLQLVKPGQGTEDTRRIAILREILDAEDEKEKVRAFIQKLIQKRLLVSGLSAAGEETLEVVHEALIREWSLFRQWISGDREFRVWQEKLRYAIQEWDENNRDRSLLLTGLNYSTSLDWFQKRGENLTSLEKLYIQSSIDVQIEQINQEEFAAKKNERIRRWLNIAAVAIVTISLHLSLFSYLKMKEADWSSQISGLYLADSSYNSTEGDMLRNSFHILKLGFSIDEDANGKIDEFIKKKYFKTLLKYVLDLKSFPMRMEGQSFSGLYLREAYEIITFSREKNEGYGERIEHTNHQDLYFSKDNNHFVYLNSEDEILKRELKTGKIIDRFKIPEPNRLQFFIYDPLNDSIYLILDGFVDVFSFENKEKLKEVPISVFETLLKKVSLSPAGDKLALIYESELYIVNLISNQIELKLENHFFSNGKFSQNGKYFLFLDQHNFLFLLDLESEEKREMKLPTELKTDIDKLGSYHFWNNELIYYRSLSDSVMVYSIAKAGVVGEIPSKNEVLHFGISSDGKYLVEISNHLDIYIREIKTDQLVKYIDNSKYVDYVYIDDSFSALIAEDSSGSLVIFKEFIPRENELLTALKVKKDVTSGDESGSEFNMLIQYVKNSLFTKDGKFQDSNRMDDLYTSLFFNDFNRELLGLHCENMKPALRLWLENRKKGLDKSELKTLQLKCSRLNEIQKDRVIQK